MTKKYQTEDGYPPEVAVPEQVSVAIAEVADDMREGCSPSRSGPGCKVMRTLMDEDVVAACGPRGRHDAERTAVRHGRGRGSVGLWACSTDSSGGAGELDRSTQAGLWM